MTREQLISAVEIRMDNVTDDNAIEVVGNANVDYLLDEQLVNAFMFLPAYVLPQSSFTSNTVNSVMDRVNKITLPDDFLRLVRFRTAGMKRPLTESDLVKEGSPEHKMMYHKYTGGGTSRPKGCIAFWAETPAKVLEYNLATGDSGTPVEARYIATPTVSDVTDELLDPVAWYIASAVLGSMGQEQPATYAMNKVQEYINLK